MNFNPMDDTQGILQKNFEQPIEVKKKKQRKRYIKNEATGGIETQLEPPIVNGQESFVLNQPSTFMEDNSPAPYLPGSAGPDETQLNNDLREGGSKSMSTTRLLEKQKDL